MSLKVNMTFPNAAKPHYWSGQYKVLLIRGRGVALFLSDTPHFFLLCKEKLSQSVSGQEPAGIPVWNCKKHKFLSTIPFCSLTVLLFIDRLFVYWFFFVLECHEKVPSNKLYYYHYYYYKHYSGRYWPE